MTANHLLSASLFSELFQHNLVSSDGRIIANEQQLRDYSTFLTKQSKDKVTRLYAERKNLVDDVEKLLRLDSRTKEEEKLLKELLNELDLKFDEEGLLSLKEPKKSQERYLGPKEPGKSVFERKIEAELKSAEILKRDLKKLDDWLEQISHLSPTKDEEEHPVDYKKAGIKYRQRTQDRMSDMEKERKKLIKYHYKDYDENLKNTLSRKLPKEKYLTRIGLKTRYAKDKAGIKDSKGDRDDKHVATKAKKNVQDKTIVNDNGKNEDVVSEAQGNTDDKTAVKDQAEDRDKKNTGNNTTVQDYADDKDVPNKAQKSINDKVADKDTAKNEDLTSETQTSTVKHNVEDGGVAIKTETNIDDKAAVNEEENSKDKASVIEATAAESKINGAVKDNSKDEDVASEAQTGIIDDNSEDRDVKAKTEKNVNDEINVVDNAEVKDAVSEAADAVTELTDSVADMSNKMHEMKKLMVLNEDTILKVTTRDDDAIEAQNGIDKNSSVIKTPNAAVRSTGINVIDNAELKDAVTKATDTVIEATDTITKTSNKMHEVRKRMIDIDDKINKEKKEVEEATSKNNPDDKVVATKAANSNDKSKEAEKNAILEPQEATQNNSKNYAKGIVSDEETQIQMDSAKEKKTNNIEEDGEL